MLALFLLQASLPCCDFSFLTTSWLRLRIHACASVWGAVPSTCSYPNIATTECDQWLWPFNTKVDPAGVRDAAAAVIAVGAWTPCFHTNTRLLQNVAAECWEFVRSVFVLLIQLCAFLSVCLFCTDCMLVVDALWNCLWQTEKAGWHIAWAECYAWDF